MVDVTHTGLIFRPFRGRRYKSIRDYAATLLLRVDYINDYGHPVGFSYQEIMDRVRAHFPVVRHPGPHCGHVPRPSLRELYNLSYSLQSNGVRLPGRPRSRRK
jgi:hypothetical protein